MDAVVKPAYLSGARAACVALGLPEKTAEAYLAIGDVQGVGLRKSLHAMLNERGIGGVAVNNPFTSNVEINLPSEHADLLEELGRKLDSDSYKIEKTTEEPKMHDVALDEKLIRRFMQRQGLTKIHGSSRPLAELDPAHRLAVQKAWLKDRYRLQDADDVLTGSVPTLAYRQLKGLAPIYSREVTNAPSTEWPTIVESPYIRRAWERHLSSNS